MNTIFDKFHEREKAALARALQGLTQKPKPLPRQKHKKSGHSGIYWHSKRRRWVVNAVIGERKRYIGATKCLDDAVEMKNAAQKEHFSQ